MRDIFMPKVQFGKCRINPRTNFLLKIFEQCGKEIEELKII